MALFGKLKEGVIKGMADKVQELTTAALQEGIEPKRILDEGLIAGMDEVGEKFQAAEMFIPEVLVAAKAMQAGMSVLRPELTKSGVESLGKIAIGTVHGDLHDIGKNLVAMMLEGAGYDIIDLGTSVTPEQFVEAAQDGANIIGMSALLTTTMISMKATIEGLKSADLKVKTIIGGAPVTQKYADEIGADGYAPDAANAVQMVKSLFQ